MNTTEKHFLLDAQILHFPAVHGTTWLGAEVDINPTKVSWKQYITSHSASDVEDVLFMLCEDTTCPQNKRQEHSDV